MNYLKVPDPYRDISAVVKVQVLAVVVWTNFKKTPRIVGTRVLELIVIFLPWVTGRSFEKSMHQNEPVNHQFLHPPQKIFMTL